MTPDEIQAHIRSLYAPETRLYGDLARVARAVGATRQTVANELGGVKPIAPRRWDSYLRYKNQQLAIVPVVAPGGDR